jgi:hypothetical protein
MRKHFYLNYTNITKHTNKLFLYHILIIKALINEIRKCVKKKKEKRKKKKEKEKNIQ